MTLNSQIAFRASTPHGEAAHRQTRMQLIHPDRSRGVVLASWGSAAPALEVRGMFAGFIAWFRRPTSMRESLSAMICLWPGIVPQAGNPRFAGCHKETMMTSTWEPIRIGHMELCRLALKRKNAAVSFLVGSFI